MQLLITRLLSVVNQLIG